MSNMHPDAPIYVAGHTGMVGQAVWRALESQGFHNLIGWSHEDLDLCDFTATMDAITSASPAVVVVAAGRVGGILANWENPVEFLNDNLRIQLNLLEAAHAANVDRLVSIGSSCIYPKFAPQPISESALLTGPLEPTNEAYAVAKIAGIVATQSFRRQYGRRWISAMPTNLYGPGDNFDLHSAHALPAILRRMADAADRHEPRVTLWGTGSPRREFLHVDDLANAILFLLRNYDAPDPINVGTGSDIAIRDLAELIAEVVGFSGEVHWDRTKPDGTPRKLLEISRIKALGWQPSIDLRQGVSQTYDWLRHTGGSR